MGICKYGKFGELVVVIAPCVDAGGKVEVDVTTFGEDVGTVEIGMKGTKGARVDISCVEEGVNVDVDGSLVDLAVGGVEDVGDDDAIPENEAFVVGAIVDEES